MTRLKILTANALLSGEVVFYAGAPGWVGDLASATRGHTPAEIAALEAVASRSEAQDGVVGPYLIDLDEESLMPHRTRERIRLAGPTVHPDLARVWQTLALEISNVSL